MFKAEAALLSPSEEQLSEAEAAVSEFDFIRFTMADMNGVPRGLLLPADVAAKSLKAGIGCPEGELIIVTMIFDVEPFKNNIVHDV